jgi:hypothetical protein
MSVVPENSSKRKPKMSPKSRRRLMIVSVILVLAAAFILVDIYLSQPINNPALNQLNQQTTSSFPTNQKILVDHNCTTNIVVEISGNTLSSSSYFTVKTTSEGTQVPKNVTALTIGNPEIVRYYSVEVSANMTLTPEVTAKVLIYNPTFSSNSAMYYWNTSEGKWVYLPTDFQSTKTLVATFEALNLTGIPIAVENIGTVAPE